MQCCLSYDASPEVDLNKDSAGSGFEFWGFRICGFRVPEFGVYVFRAGRSRGFGFRVGLGFRV